MSGSSKTPRNVLGSPSPRARERQRSLDRKEFLLAIQEKEDVAKVEADVDEFVTQKYQLVGSSEDSEDEVDDEDAVQSQGGWADLKGKQVPGRVEPQPASVEREIGPVQVPKELPRLVPVQYGPKDYGVEWRFKVSDGKTYTWSLQASEDEDVSVVRQVARQHGFRVLEGVEEGQLDRRYRLLENQTAALDLIVVAQADIEAIGGLKHIPSKQRNAWKRVVNVAVNKSIKHTDEEIRVVKKLCDEVSRRAASVRESLQLVGVPQRKIDEAESIRLKKRSWLDLGQMVDSDDDELRCVKQARRSKDSSQC
ncbi:hypothetical protein BGZ99_002170 [Dissophora globulifera]|uniref:Uncharacterized protein n=1 Tax=Dissophora globulifera TaxID=979702 RepID=A0A9P6R0X0_9FUNG|nr:hypothetical protein BGZ99_002170 [Dissophora globulifera]